MKKCGIYGIHNVVNGKWYVGQSQNINLRRRSHFWELSKNRHGNAYLQFSYIKHGLDNLEFRVLEETPENMLDVRESAWIAFYHSNDSKYGYNLEDGGHLNKHLSSETRLKMSEAHKGEKGYWFGKHFPAEMCRKLSETHIGQKGVWLGKQRSEESRHRMSESKTGYKNCNFGKHHSEKMRQKISEKLKGHIVSKETREKISKANTGKCPSEEMRRKMSESRKNYFIKKKNKVL